MLRRLLFPGLFLVSLAACAQPAPATKPAAARPAAAQALPNFVPREGVDYEVLAAQQPTFGKGKIEVAEVFSYRCVHCAEFQPKVNAWKKSAPADVRWEYVPGVFGGTWDTFARAYFAAEAMGVQPRTHDLVFKGVFVDQTAGNGTLEDIAKMYAKWGVDQAKFLATMNSFGVTAKLNRARQFALRTGVQSTPTFIINGKYAANMTGDRREQGLFDTILFLTAHERAGTTP